MVSVNSKNGQGFWGVQVGFGSNCKNHTFTKIFDMKLKLALLSHKLVILGNFALKITLKWWDEFTVLFMAFAASFFMEIWKFIIGVGVLIVFDMIMAIIANMKGKKAGQADKEIKSGKLFRTAMKFVTYSIPIIVAHLIVRVFKVPDGQIIVKGIAAFLCMVEVKSIDENFKLITGKSVLKQLIQVFNKKKESNEK